MRPLTPVALLALLLATPALAQPTDRPNPPARQPDLTAKPAPSTDDKAAIEKAVKRFADACEDSDLVAMNDVAAPELRMLLRALFGMQDSTVDPADTDDDKTIARLADNLDNLPPLDQLPFAFIPASSIVSIDVKGDSARVLVASDAAKRPRRLLDRNPEDAAPGERHLITTPPPNDAAPKAATPPTKDPTGVVLLRRHEGVWKVSMAAPTGKGRAPIARPHDAALGDSPEEAAAVLDAQVGDLTVRDIFTKACASHKTFGSPAMLDIHGPMSDAFKAHLKQRTGKDAPNAHIDLTFACESATKVYLLNPNEPTTSNLDLTDQQLWEAMVDFAKK